MHFLYNKNILARVYLCINIYTFQSYFQCSAKFAYIDNSDDSDVAGFDHTHFSEAVRMILTERSMRWTVSTNMRTMLTRHPR